MRNLMTTTAVILFLGLGAFWGSGAADAADLGTPRMSEPVPYLPPAFSWTGFYLGVNGGYGVGGAHEDVIDFGFASEINSRGGLAGGQIGLNWQLGQSFLIGVEGEGDWADIRDGGLEFTSDGVYHNLHAKADWLADVSGRAGFTFDRTLVYGKGGYAWAGLKYDSVIRDTTYPVGESTNAGWLVGGGVESFFTPNWSVKVEYNHADFGKNRYHVTGPVDIDASQTLDVVKAGLNYKFGGREVQPLK
jgi:outer membrane immunogenic protein